MGWLEGWDWGLKGHYGGTQGCCPLEGAPAEGGLGFPGSLGTAWQEAGALTGICLGSESWERVGGTGPQVL